MAQKLNEITALHQHMYDGEASDAWQYCEHCKTGWPCDTMRIVERVTL